MTYDPAQHVDPLFPKGRPACTRCHDRPTYLGGLCGLCYSVEGQWQREHDDTQGRHYGLTGPGSSASTECPTCRRPGATDAQA